MYSGQSLVTTKTPLRVSFAGGGTDLPSYYEAHGGAVVSSTIDKYVYVTVKTHRCDIFPDKYRLNYHDSEHVTNIEDIKNDIIRECLIFMEYDDPLYVSTVADVPASSGLGSSSSFAVGLLSALHLLKGERVSIAQLAEEACEIEISRLGHPIGKQDQYAAAFGGLNRLVFATNGTVSIDPIRLSKRSASGLFDNIMMFWTSIERSANTILAEQKESTVAGDKSRHLDLIKSHSSALYDFFTGGYELDQFGQLLDETWAAKRELATLISNPEIDKWYNSAMSAGAFGGKISGAGGGGFLMLIVPDHSRHSVRQALSELVELEVNYEPRGTQLVTVF